MEAEKLARDTQKERYRGGMVTASYPGVLTPMTSLLLNPTEIQSQRLRGLEGKLKTCTLEAHVKLG